MTTDEQTPHDGLGDGPRSGPATGRSPHWAFAVLPAAALVVGLVVGGVVVGLARGNDGPGATATVTVSPTAGKSDDTAVVVPRECIQAAESVQEATKLIRDNVAAIRDFRAQDIVDMLNKLEDLDSQATEQAKTCSDVRVNPTSAAGSASP